MYAKVKGASVLIYPYTMDTLKSENPYTNFNGKTDLMSLYQGTENQKETGARIVEVTVLKLQSYQRNQDVILNDEPHQNDEGDFVLGYTITEKTGTDLEQEEIKTLSIYEEKISYIKQEYAQNVSSESNLSEAKKAEWVSYFEELDNISELEGYPWSFEFPNMPSEQG